MEEHYPNGEGEEEVELQVFDEMISGVDWKPCGGGEMRWSFELVTFNGTNCVP